jgi:hypothetical protein
MVALMVWFGSGAQAQQNVDNQFNGNTFAFDRHVAQLSLTQAFY